MGYATAMDSGPSWSSCSYLVTALEGARMALIAGDPVNAGADLARAHACAIEIYGHLDPTRSVVCAHIQGLLETCISRIEHAQRNSDGAALDAALQLVQPLQSMLAHVID
jgi:hypothetical protein